MNRVVFHLACICEQGSHAVTAAQFDPGLCVFELEDHGCFGPWPSDFWGIGHISSGAMLGIVPGAEAAASCAIDLGHVMSWDIPADELDEECHDLAAHTVRVYGGYAG